MLEDEQQQYVQEAQQITNVPTQPPFIWSAHALLLITPRRKRGVWVQKNDWGYSYLFNRV